MLAWDWNGYSYSAAITRAAFLNASSTFPVVPLAGSGCATYQAGYADGSYTGAYDGGFYASARSGYGDYYYDRPQVVYEDYGSYSGFGFGYGVRRLGLGYSAAYYGLAYDHPLFCGDMIDCYAAPVYGAVEAPAPYEAPPAAPDEAATILLQVQPTSAQIFVDGEFVGTVDDLQSALIVAPGVHRVEFRAPGYDPLVVDVRVAPGGRITYRASLKPSA